MAFVPDPLPRHLSLDSSLVYHLDEATRAVATLAGVGETIPNPHLLTGPFMRREAVLSSRIEGTQASLSDLYLYEASRRATGDVLEVYNYVRALEEGLDLLDKLPISFRLINSVHSTLLEGVRGQERRPGEIRAEQVWLGSEGTPIGDARFIPPPANLVRDLMLDWEKYANENVQIPPLVQCALLHYQFETIHPYLDGNGRIGRLLVILFLCAKQVLRTPLLYLSAYFERTRQEYYEQLLQVSATGNWDAWLHYFLRGVAEQADDALVRTRQVRELQANYRSVLQEKRESGNALRLVDFLFSSPYITTPLASHLLGVTSAGARGILERLVDAGILVALSEYWPRQYVARDLLKIIEADSSTAT
jgi:Fic family protein